jgi:membrane protein DedA with SNARE-associated domain/rhodanese-related sulfurtransferase
VLNSVETGAKVMNHIVPLLAHYGLLAVFAAVFLDEIGIPAGSPVVIMTAAAYSARTPQALAAILVTGLAGGMSADLIWFLAARRHGRRLLAFACRFSSSPQACMRRTSGVYTRYGNLSLMASKFIPGTGIIAIALAGAADLGFPAFLGFTAGGLLALHTIVIVLGVVFHSAVHEVIGTLAALGPYGVGLVATVVLGYIAFRWLRHRAFANALKMARISVEELAGLMDGERKPVLVDVRSEAMRAKGVIPGALHASPAEAKTTLAHLPRDIEIVVYCSCPNEISAAVAARHLRTSGFKHIRPLAGGYEAWVAAGLPVDVQVA